MAQYPNQPPYGQPPQGQPQPPYQNQPQQPYQPQPPYQNQPQPSFGQQGQAYQPQYPAPQPSAFQPQPQYQPQPQFQAPTMQANPIASFTGPAQSVPFSAQNAVGVFLSYIFLILAGPTPVLVLYSYGVGIYSTSGANFRFEGLIPLAGALIVYLLEKNNPFVRFHAAQALVFSIAWIVLEFIIGLLESVSALATIMIYLSQILFVGYAFIVAYVIYRAAYKSELYKLPLIGGIVQNMAGAPVTQ